MMIVTPYRHKFFTSFGDQVTAAYSDRQYDASKRPEFLEMLGLDPSKLFLVRQVHGENIVRVSADTSSTAGMMADGLITDTPGVALGILTADCVPVFFWDPVKRIAGIAHAGWRGAYHGIAPKMVSAFQQNFGSQVREIRAAFGPCIRQDSYEVDAEFETWFPGFYRPSAKQGKGHVDLAGFIRARLIEAGILPQNIEDCGHCTYQEQDHFYSYRRENQTRERILSVISMRGEKVNEGQ